MGKQNTFFFMRNYYALEPNCKDCISTLSTLITGEKIKDGLLPDLTKLKWLAD